jgi:regulator of nucleoside diphosphate kinase
MTVISLRDFTLSPDIALTAEDHRRLTELAHAGSGAASTVADYLLGELDRASVVPSGQLPPDVVRMGSTVRYRTGDADSREVTLVFPAEADIDRNRVSVLTPIGAALIGLRKGQAITCRTRDGRNQMLTVLQVTPPERGEPEPPAAA